MARTIFLGMALVLCNSLNAVAGGPDCQHSGPREATAALRDRGPEGLDLALRAYDAVLWQRDERMAELNRLINSNEHDSEAVAMLQRKLADIETQLTRMAKEIDQIGGQRNCTASRLYWYTDLDAAKAAAAKSGRPILSLRLLGKLTDEYSCANSRFFRTALYANKAINDYLRDNYVLHWQTVRPVPIITIDFGDGRTLRRTITGNSAHYILTANGNPLDVLPGLYAPRQFQKWVERMRSFHDNYVAAPTESRAKLLQAFHARRRDLVLQQWEADLERLGTAQEFVVMTRLVSNPPTDPSNGQSQVAEFPVAAQASNRSAAKREEESPVLRFANLGGERLEQTVDDDIWRAIAELHRADAKVDPASVQLMAAELPTAEVAGRVATAKYVAESPLLRIVRTFEDSMALDTVRNEYVLHRRIHEQFADAGSMTFDVDSLNEWVYADLFLTPSSDPWLGLVPKDTYTALDNAGCSGPGTEWLY